MSQGKGSTGFSGIDSCGPDFGHPCPSRRKRSLCPMAQALRRVNKLSPRLQCLGRFVGERGGSARSEEVGGALRAEMQAGGGTTSRKGAG